ncbi:sugar transferase [candidate division WOR-3 bacterium]|nr:sugar transferase [candidate division WOR-3 bacterium]
MKRVLDIFFSIFGLWFVALIFPLVALAIKLDSRGPALYRGVRVGRDGRLFKIFKFRTMIEGADKCGPKLTYRNDPRITKMGGLLRRLKVDELPQLINVFLGQMSIVGPRPEDPQYVSHYTEGQRAILSVKPGITGPAQIHYVDIESHMDPRCFNEQYIDEIIPEKFRLNMLYIQNRSLALDMRILWRTFLSLFRTEINRVKNNRNNNHRENTKHKTPAATAL